MKLPRDISGEQLATILGKYGYHITRQTGSHFRLESVLKGSTHRITIPQHDTIKVGTLSSILSDLAFYLEIEKQKLIDDLFG